MTKAKTSIVYCSTCGKAVDRRTCVGIQYENEVKTWVCGDCIKNGEADKVFKVVREKIDAVAVADEPIPTYTREALIDLCRIAIVPESNWRNRDSASAQKQIGEAWALLRAGCEFTQTNRGDMATTNDTIWIEISSRGFNSFEFGDEGHYDHDLFYIPTPDRLDRANGGDWY